MRKIFFYMTGLFILFFVRGECVCRQNIYHHIFNPVRGYVTEVEKPFRNELYLNGKWQFMQIYETDMVQFVKPDTFQWDAVPLKVPSPCN